MVKKTRTTLSNGLPLVVIEIPDSKSLVTSFWTKAGSRFDLEGKAGLAHFMEHLLLKKTKRYPSDMKLAQVLEKVGAYKNGTTSKDWMNLNITSYFKNLPLTLEILSEIVFNPLIDKEGFEAERKVILQEQARKKSLPDDLVWEVWYKLFFNPSPLADPVLGDENSLANMELSDPISFWGDQSSKDSNMVFVSGGIKTSEAIDLSEKYFGKYHLKSGEVKHFSYKDDKRILIEKMDLPRTNMMMSFRIPGGEVYQDLYSLLALRGILALGWSSRIYQRLRVKESLIYTSRSEIMRYLDTGAFTFNSASDKKNFPRMISVLCEELVRLREKGVTQEELDLVKGYIEGVVLSSIETSWDYADWYAIDELHWPGSVETPEERIAKIKKVTKEDVEGVAKKYLTKDNWHLAVVGDVKEKDIKVDL